jgi:acetyl esterase/lipase
MLRRLFLVAVIAGLLVGGCSQSDDATSDETTTTTTAPTTTTSTAPTTTTSTASTTTTTIAPTTVAESQTAMVTEKDLVYATYWEGRSLTLDMSVPSKPADAPVVIYLPGRGGHSAPPEMVEGLVEEGAFVFGVRYAFSGSGPEQVLADHGAVAGAMAESVACAVNFARAQASKFGNDDPVVVLTGLSNGGGLAAHVALFGADVEARWDEYAAEGGPPRQVECEVTDGSTQVDAVVGMNGEYDVFVPIFDGGYGRTHQQFLDPELWEFLSSSIGVNPDLKIRLIHGESDIVIPYSNSVGFAAALTDAGYDVGEVIAFDGEHHWVPPELAIPTVMELIGP